MMHEVKACELTICNLRLTCEHGFTKETTPGGLLGMTQAGYSGIAPGIENGESMGGKERQDNYIIIGQGREKSH